MNTPLISDESQFYINAFKDGEKAERVRTDRVIVKLKRYFLDNDHGCDDPDCCGGRSYYMSESEDGEYVKMNELLIELNSPQNNEVENLNCSRKVVNSSEGNCPKPFGIGVVKQLQTGSDISLCKNCYCMTKDIFDKSMSCVYCGKCQSFKFEKEQEKK